MLKLTALKESIGGNTLGNASHKKARNITEFAISRVEVSPRPQCMHTAVSFSIFRIQKYVSCTHLMFKAKGSPEKNYATLEAEDR